MAAHRYWGLDMFARAGSGDGIAVAELEMRGSPGGADLCSGGTAGGSATSGTTVAQAFDNDTTTGCYNGATGGGFSRLTYDFGSPVSIVEMVVTTPGAAYFRPGATYGPAFCRVLWSDNGSTWNLGTTAFDASPLGNAETMVVGGISDASPLGDLPSLTVTLSKADRVYWGGLGKIVGTAKIKGTPNTPVHRRVRLIREVDAVCVDEQWSDPATGAYEFLGIDPALLYTVIVYDGPRVFRAAVQDAVVPEIYTP